MKRNCIRRPTLLLASPTTKTSQPSLGWGFPYKKCVRGRIRERPLGWSSSFPYFARRPDKVVGYGASPTTLSGRRAKQRTELPYNFIERAHVKFQNQNETTWFLAEWKLKVLKYFVKVPWNHDEEITQTQCGNSLTLICQKIRESNCFSVLLK